MEGEKVSAVELPAAIFEAPINVDLMHQAYVRQMANARLGTHKTKTRGEVSGGGRKPWKQKGTGRARQGSTRCCAVGGWWTDSYTPAARLHVRACRARCAGLLCVRLCRVKAAEDGIVVVDDAGIAGSQRPA